MNKESFLKLGLIACLILSVCVIASIEPVQAADNWEYSNGGFEISDLSGVGRTRTCGEVPYEITNDLLRFWVDINVTELTTIPTLITTEVIIKYTSPEDSISYYTLSHSQSWYSTGRSSVHLANLNENFKVGTYEIVGGNSGIGICQMKINSPASPSTKSVFYPSKGTNPATLDIYTSSGICQNNEATAPCARYDKNNLRVDMDRDTVRYQVKNNLGQWRWIKYDIPNPSGKIPSLDKPGKSLIWSGMYANGTNLAYRMQDHGIKLDIWGSGTPPSDTFTFTYTLSGGLTHRMQGEEILFMDAVTGEPLWLVKYPTMQVNGTNVPLEFTKNGDKITIHAPDLLTNPDYNFSAGWELDPSTQSGSTIYISDRQNLTQVLTDIANSSALSNDGSGNCLLNANLINNNTANRFYMNDTDALCYASLRINSTNTSGTPTFWYYLTSGQTEINNFKITSWNTTSNTVEDLPAISWARSAVYASGASSKMNISNSNLSYLGYNAENMYGVFYRTSSGNIITNNSFLQNYVGLFLSSASNNTLINNTGTSYGAAYGICLASLSNYNNLTWNTGTSANNFGIYLTASSYNNLTGNTGTSTNSIGFRLAASLNNNLTANKGTSATSYGLYTVTGSNNNSFTSNIWTSASSVGASFDANSNGNTIVNDTGTSTSLYGILLSTVSNNTFIGGSYSSVSSYPYYILASYNNNTFNSTNFTTRKVVLGDNTSIFQYDNGTGVWLKTQAIITPTTSSITTRSLYSWTNTNLTFSETWSAARTIQYNISGLIPNVKYFVYNGSAIDYTYTTDASGILTPFTINFTTSAKTVSVLADLCSGYQSGSNIYVGNCNNLTALNETIRNPAVLQNLGSGQWLLNANLTNDNVTNTFYFNSSDVTWLKINSTHTSTDTSFWYYFSQGKTEIANTKITSWNTTSGNVESLPSTDWQRSAIYADGTDSKLNISNSNLSYLGYSDANMYGVGIANSTGNIISGNTFLQNFIGLLFENSSNNILTDNTAINTVYGYGIVLYEYSNNNTLTNNTGTGYSAPGIMIYLSSDNILIDNTGTSTIGAGILLDGVLNTTITGGSFSSTGDDYVIANTSINNTFNNTDFTTRKIYYEDNISVFEYDNGAGVWLRTQIVSPAAYITTTRTLLKWTNYNLSWSETWSAGKQIQYNVSGLLPNRDYLVYNGSVLDYQYTSDASGILTPFSISFATTAKTITVSLTNLNVSGHVYNELGLALQDARIDMDSNYAFSDASGYYNFSSLPAGEYDILARKIGYENNTNTTLLYSDTIVNFTLEEFRPPDYTDLIEGILGMVVVLLAVVIASRKRKERKENRTDINNKKGDNNSW